MENIFVEFLPPWVETGIQPAFYDKESGTVLQQTARMYARVNMLIRMFNKLSKNTKETIEEYINKFNELHDYVQDYFDNLDVQEEINNKLDEMAEDGTLADIIADYIQLRGILAYNSISDLKNATNIVNGSFAETYGFYANGDGGGAKYKIRNITNDDVVDEITLFSITADPTNTLVAELVIEDGVINILQCGAKNDGSESVSTIMNNLITNHNDCTLYVPNGDYLLSATINLGTGTKIQGENKWKTRFFTNSDIVMFQNKDDDIAVCNISNLWLDGNDHATKGIYLYRDNTNLVYNDSRTELRSLMIKRCTDWCLQLGDPDTSSNVIEVVCDDIYVHQFSGGGVYISRCTDSHFSNIRAGGGANTTKPAIQVEGYNIQIINSKAFLAGKSDTPVSGWVFNGGTNVVAEIEAQANTKHGVEINNTKDSTFTIVADKNGVTGGSYAGIVVNNTQNCTINAVVSNDVVADGYLTATGCKLIAPKRTTLNLNVSSDVANGLDLSEYNTNQVLTVNSEINLNGYTKQDITPAFNNTITVPEGITLTKLNNSSMKITGSVTSDSNIWICGSYGSHTPLAYTDANHIYELDTANLKVGLVLYDYVTNIGGGFDRKIVGTSHEVTGVMIQLKANTSYDDVISPKIIAISNK